MKLYLLLFILALPAFVFAEGNMDIPLGVRVDRTNVTCTWDSTDVCNMLKSSNENMTNCDVLTNISVQNCSYEYGLVTLEFANTTYQYQHNSDLSTTITRGFGFNNDNTTECSDNTTCNITIDDIKLLLDSEEEVVFDYDRVRDIVNAKACLENTCDTKSCVDKSQEALNKCEEARSVCEGKTCEVDNTWVYVLLTIVILAVLGVAYLIRSQGGGEVI
jgi:hypothetical protein